MDRLNSKQIVIYGAGGFAREVAWLAESCNTTERLYEVVCFVDDNEGAHGRVLNGVPIMGLDEAWRRFPKASVVGGVGSPETRQLLMERTAEAGFAFTRLIHPSVERSNWIQIGNGVVICAGNILTTNIQLGKHVQINLDCTIGHDVVMGDYTTLAPGVHVSGCVRFGQRVYVGTGAVIINGTQENPLIIEDDAVIGAGACVTKNIERGLTVVGIPAKPLGRK